MSGIKELLKRKLPAPVINVLKRARRPFTWHKMQVGGMWDVVGNLQYEFLAAQGLAPQHYFLDVGCGCLRGGVRFIKHLEPGHYYGVDISDEILAMARKELARHNLDDKQPVLRRTDTFDFPAPEQGFDYAIAQSVFTHLPLNDITRCLMNMDKVLKPGGRFYATFFDNPQGKRHLTPLMHRCADGYELYTYFDRDPFHYDVATFEWICAGTGLKVEHIGAWNHPRDQRMLVFVKQ